MTRLGFPELPSLPDLSLPSLGTTRLRRPAQRLPDLTPEEEESLLEKLGSNLLGGLARVGNVLGTPLSIVSGTLAGEPGQALKGIFNPNERIYPREMLEKWNALAPNKPGLDLGDVVAFGVGLPLDPLFWIGGPISGLSRAGRLAKTTGLLKQLPTLAGKLGRRQAQMRYTPKNLIESLAPEAQEEATKAFGQAAAGAGISAGEYLERPLGGLFNLGPLGTPQVTVGTGPLAQKIAKGIDAFGNIVGQSPPGRAAKMLFGWPYKGLYKPMEQKLAATVSAGEDASRAEAVLKLRPIEKRFRALVQDFETTYGSSILHGGSPAGQLAASIKGFTTGDVVYAADRANYGYVRALDPKTATVFFRNPQSGSTALVKLPYDQLSLTAKAGTKEAVALGQDATTDLVESLTYFVGERQGTVEQAFAKFAPGVQPTPQIKASLSQLAEQWKAPVNEGHMASLARGVDVGHISSSTDFAYMTRNYSPEVRSAAEKYRRIGQRGHVGQIGRTSPIAYLSNDMGNTLAGDPAVLDPITGVNYILKTYGHKLNKGGLYASEKDHAVALAKFVRSLPEHVRTDGRLFTAKIEEATLTAVTGNNAVNNVADGIHSLFYESLTVAPDGIPLAEAFKKAGLKSDPAVNWFLLNVAKTAKDSAEALQMAPAVGKTLRVAPDAVDAAAVVFQKFQSAEWGSHLGYWFDTVNRWARQNFTLPFPAYHGRNLGSGQGVNIMSDIMEKPSDFGSYAKEFWRAARYWKNPQSIPDETLDELIAYNIGTGRVHTFAGVEAVELGAPGAVPGRPWALREQFRAAMAQSAEARKVAGKGPPRIPSQIGAAYRTMLSSGSRTAQMVEWQNRVSPYLFLKKKGWSAAAAAEKVNDLQFDYSKLAPFEKVAMRRGFLFYTFTRKALGMVLSQLAERPGGVLSQAIQASARSYAPGTLVPKYVQRGTAIPIGESPEGDRQYITGLGLAHEDPLSLFGGTVQDIGFEILQRAAPWIKYPAERIHEISYFGGRKLEDMDPLAGRVVANVMGRDDVPRVPAWARTPVREAEIAVGSTPAARYLSTAAQLTHRRRSALAKTVGFVSGVKISAVPPWLEAKLARAAAEDALRELPEATTFEAVSIPPDKLIKLPPEEQLEAIENMRYIRMMARRMREQNEARQQQTRGGIELPFGI